MTSEETTAAVFRRIPPHQWAYVTEAECDIDAEFMGFLNIYRCLAEIIPTHFSVVDLGCAYAAQAFLFEGHKEYVGVDFMCERRFSSSNTRHFNMTISEFIASQTSSFDLDETFAICSYVPPWHDENDKLVRAAFQNVFTFYPSDKAFFTRVNEKMRASFENRKSPQGPARPADVVWGTDASAQQAFQRPASPQRSDSVEDQPLAVEKSP